MARFYGSDSKYLIREDHEYFLWVILVLLSPVILIFLLIKFFSPPVVVGAALVLLLFVIKWMQPLVYYFKTKSIKFYKGRYGEKDIKKQLAQLPDTYSAFQGVVLDKARGDIDFVLVGPKGVLSLEVKSLGGNIKYDGKNLTINGKPILGKNFLNQAFGEAKAVADFIRRHLSADVYVKPVLLFSNDYATVEFGNEPVDNVYITQKDLLFGVIHSFPDYEWQSGERDKIEALLAVTVK